MLRHGFNFIKAPNFLKGFGKAGNEIESHGVIKESLRVDECVEKDIIFRVVPDDVMPFDVIVGQNFTELPNVTYYKVDNELIFKNRQDFPFENFPETEQAEKSVNPKCLESTHIGPASVKFVRAYVNECELQVPLYNMSHNEITINKNDLLPSVILVVNENEHKPQVKLDPIAESDVIVGPAVTAEQKASLLNLLNEFRVCCSKRDTELGCTNLIEMDIIEKPGSSPVYSKPYKTSIEQRAIMRKIVRDWKSQGIVTETNSEYASPCILVKKSDGTHRLVVDYRRLNKNTVRMNFPIPSIDDGLEEINGAKIFAILDLAQGFLQIPLKDSAKEKTAFITPDETGQFERAMFGLMNSPFYFAKLMKKIFGKYAGKLILFFYDDMCIYAKTWAELLEKLYKVLCLLRDAGFMIKLRKCKFGLEEMEYVGFVIGKDGIKPGPRNLTAISQFPIPKNEHEVRRFIGMASYFRRFVRNFAQIAAPLTELLRKNQPFVWKEQQEMSFNETRRKLSSQPVLMPFNVKSPRTELHVDASSQGLGAILLQVNDREELHPVYAVSRRTSDVESAYHSTKLELLAIIWAMDKLRHLLLSVSFIVYTDCQALVYVNTLKTKKPQIIRWLGEIADFDYEIRHRKGEKMQHVDALSRAPVEIAEENFKEARVLNTMVHEGEILMYQHMDELLKRKIDILKKAENKRTRREKGEVNGYALRNGVLYKVEEKTKLEKYVVPAAMRKALVIKNHDFSGHFGIDQTVAKISNFYYFPRMRNYVKCHINSCIECIYAKNKVGKQPGELHPIPPGKRPFDVVHLDHLGPFVTSKQVNKYILAAVCNLTKFCQLYPVCSVKAAPTVQQVEKLINRFGASTRFITDRGKAFDSKKFKKLCSDHGIKHTLNSSRHAQANGQVE